ncbi:hypothetical protein AURDEDRAFT_116299 [Auricularia subglabra TFB-10046 SS5]|nr:hypothetical protein AURDEDRAFT_116299 [Auricularia subglabra TFB-10046 SS5]
MSSASTMVDTASIASASSWRSTFVDRLRHSFSSATYTVPERAQSRGRDVVSTGRGGVGNMRVNSGSRDARPLDGPDDFSSTRGRELPPKHIVTHSGRGGAGNVRSPSRDPEVERQELAREHERIVQHMHEEENMPHSSGRGGAGNIARSRSRGPAPTLMGTGTGTTSAASTVHPSASTGKGGYGNIAYQGAGYDLEAERKAAEAAREKHHDKPHFHVFSSGKGTEGAREEQVEKLA